MPPRRLSFPNLTPLSTTTSQSQPQVQKAEGNSTSATSPTSLTSPKSPKQVPNTVLSPPWSSPSVQQERSVHTSFKAWREEQASRERRASIWDHLLRIGVKRIDEDSTGGENREDGIGQSGEADETARRISDTVFVSECSKGKDGRSDKVAGVESTTSEKGKCVEMDEVKRVERREEGGAKVGRKLSDAERRSLGLEKCDLADRYAEHGHW